MAEPFLSNNELRAGEHVNIYYNEWLENDVHYISHWVNGNGSFLTFVEFGAKNIPSVLMSLHTLDMSKDLKTVANLHIEIKG